MRRDEYAWTGKSRHISSYITQIPAWKRADAPWLSEVDSMALQQSLRDLDKAFKNFFRAPGKVGFPEVQVQTRGRKSYRTNGVGIIDARHVRLPKLGTVRARGEPSRGGARPVRDGQAGAERQVIRGDMLRGRPSPRTRRPRPTAGSWESMREYDIATCSTGSACPTPKTCKGARGGWRGSSGALAQAEGLRKSRQAACQGRAGAREGCQPAEGRPAQVHGMRWGESQNIAVEDLNVRGMQRNRRLAKAVGDAAMSELARQLEYKCAWSGARLRKGGQVLSVQQDVFRMRLRLQGTDAGRTGMGLPRAACVTTAT